MAYLDNLVINSTIIDDSKHHSFSNSDGYFRDAYVA